MPEEESNWDHSKQSDLELEPDECLGPPFCETFVLTIVSVGKKLVCGVKRTFQICGKFFLILAFKARFGLKNKTFQVLTDIVVTCRDRCNPTDILSKP